MLAIKTDETASEQKCTPNILPCRVSHNGTINASKRYWEPSVEDDKTRTAYFRGRKLRGKVIRVPEGYRGVVIGPADKLLPRGNSKRPPEGNGIPGGNPSADSDDEQPEEIKVMEEHASFDEIVVWGHEALPDTSTDPYAKGIEEWIEFAGQVGDNIAKFAGDRSFCADTANQINSFPPPTSSWQGAEGEGD